MMRQLDPTAVRRTLATALVLVACAAAEVSAGRADHFGKAEWKRELIRLEVEPAVAVYPFDISEEMVRWARETIGPKDGVGDAAWLERLQTALFDPSFDFTYTADLTLTAPQAFAHRRGNCMSFTALFVALARSAGIGAFLLSVEREPTIDRDDGLVVLNRHVVAAYRKSSGGVTTFDFFVQRSEPYLHRRVVDDVEATAMYHANLGGSAIRAGRESDAIQHLEIATVLSPEWAPGWINMGVARNRLGDSDAALDAYVRALEADPNESSALKNMAAIYFDRGLVREAEMALRAAAQHTANPFTLIAAADVEMVRGRYDAARGYLRTARKRYGSEPEVHLALARLADREGRPARAEKHRKRAEKLASR
jgi:Flp pilus assembly protein TadD